MLVILIPAALSGDKRGYGSAVSLPRLIVGTKALAVSSVDIMPMKSGFDMTPRHQPISEETRELIDRVLLEKISLAGIEAGEGGFTKVATILC